MNTVLQIRELNAQTVRPPSSLPRAAIIALISSTVGLWASPPLEAEQWVIQILHEFVEYPPAPARPAGPLIEQSDGSFVGAAQNGVYRLAPNGSLSTLFGWSGTDNLIQTSDGNFYGSCSDMIFKMAPDGTLTTGTSLRNDHGEPVFHVDALAQAGNGNLYVAASPLYDGPTPSIFSLGPDGKLATFYEFTGTNNPFQPYGFFAGFAEGVDSNLYGLISSVGHDDILFRLTKGAELTILASLSPWNGLFGSLIQGRDGTIYGVSGNQVFKLGTNGTAITLASFGDQPSSLSQGNDGNLYGILGFLNPTNSVFKLSTQGKVTILTSFAGDGAYVRPGSDGNLYGTGMGRDLGYLGSAFKITPDGNVAVIARFGTPGGYPPALLIPGKGGDLYGTTSGGSANAGETVFKMTSAGDFATIFSAPNPSAWPPGDPISSPITKLFLGKDGYLYGFSGITDFDPVQTMFRMTTNGEVCFSLRPPGGGMVDLVEAPNGILYGTTYKGGNSEQGWIFSLDHLGGLYPFGPFDHFNTFSPWNLVAGVDGNLYCTASSEAFGHGEANRGEYLLRITPDIADAVLLATNSNGFGPLLLGQDGKVYGRRATDNGNSSWFVLNSSGHLSELPWPPEATNVVFQGRDGNFYGTIPGPSNSLVFRLTLDGALTTLCPLPPAGSILFQGEDGNLYGILGADTTTKPPSRDSIFRLVQRPRVQATASAHGEVTLNWNSFTNALYRVEYSSSLTATNWNVLNPRVTATGRTTSLMDGSLPAGQRYYRIRLLP